MLTYEIEVDQQHICMCNYLSSEEEIVTIEGILLFCNIDRSNKKKSSVFLWKNVTYFHFYFLLLPPGFTHSPGRHLFELGRPASRALKAFAEEGRGIRSSGSRWMVGEEDEEDEDGAAAAEAVFDAFAAPPIRKGTGRTRARIFVDSKHSKVSNKMFYVVRFIVNGLSLFFQGFFCVQAGALPRLVHRDRRPRALQKRKVRGQDRGGREFDVFKKTYV